MTYCGDKILYDCQECITDNQGNPKIISYNSRHDCTKCINNNEIISISLPCQSCTETYRTGDAWKNKNPEPPLSSCHKCKVRGDQEYWVGCPDNSECINGDCKPICNPPCSECEACECVNPKCSKTICKKVCKPEVSCFGGTICKDLAFDNIPIENDQIISYSIDIDPNIDGDIDNLVISFNIDNLDPVNKPIIIFARFDDTLDQMVYENITTEIVAGRISGRINSVGIATIITNTLFNNNINIQQMSDEDMSDLMDEFDPCLVLTTAPFCGGNDGNACGFDLDVSYGEPCPGNTTRGNWVITNGVLTPRLLATKCDCYEPSFFTVDMVVGAAGTVGAARGAACAIGQGIKSLGISQLKDSIYYLNLNMMNTRLALAKQIPKLRQLGIAKEWRIKYILTEADEIFINAGQAMTEARTAYDDALGAALGLDPGDEISEESSQYILHKYFEWTQDPYATDPNGFFAKIRDTYDEFQESLALTEEALAEKIKISKSIDELTEQIVKEQIEVDTLTTELDGAKSILISKKAEVAEKLAQRAGMWESLKQSVAEGVATAFTTYAMVNEISVKKTCEPTNETLNPLTCECCSNCSDGKVFPSPMNGCDCECPSGKEPCLKVGDNGCYDPCPSGQVRILKDCSCYETPSSQSVNLLP